MQRLFMPDWQEITGGTDSDQFVKFRSHEFFSIVLSDPQLL
jgi:hypothetical protein